jgi:hypothetical protein
MVVTQFEVTVLGGDSVFYNFISSGGLANGPRGFVPFPELLAEAEPNEYEPRASDHASAVKVTPWPGSNRAKPLARQGIAEPGQIIADEFLNCGNLVRRFRLPAAQRRRRLNQDRRALDQCRSRRAEKGQYSGDLLRRVRAQILQA